MDLPGETQHYTKACLLSGVDGVHAVGFPVVAEKVIY